MNFIKGLKARFSLIFKGPTTHQTCISKDYFFNDKQTIKRGFFKFSFFSQGPTDYHMWFLNGPTDYQTWILEFSFKNQQNIKRGFLIF